MTHTKVLTLALEDGARRYRKSLHHLVGTTDPAVTELDHPNHIDTAQTTAASPQIEQHLELNPECRLVIIDVLARVRPRGRRNQRIPAGL